MSFQRKPLFHEVSHKKKKNLANTIKYELENYSPFISDMSVYLALLNCRAQYPPTLKYCETL